MQSLCWLSSALSLDTRLLSHKYLAKLSAFENRETSIFVISKALCHKTGELHNLQEQTVMSNTALKAHGLEFQKG